MSNLRGALNEGFDVVLERNEAENSWNVLSGLFAGPENPLGIVVVPDMSHNLIADAERMKDGLAFAHIVPDMPDNARRDVAAVLRAGAADVLFVTPERFTQQRFVQFMQALKPGLILVGSAQRSCEAELDYSPSYNVLRRLRHLFPEIPLLAFVDRLCTGRQLRALTMVFQLHLAPESIGENNSGEWECTFPLFEQGKSLAEVANMVEKDSAWCLDALLNFIRQTGRTNPFPWVEQPAYLIVAMVAGQSESNSPEIVLPILGDRVPAPMAQLVLATLQNRSLKAPQGGLRQ